MQAEAKLIASQDAKPLDVLAAALKDDMRAVDAIIHERMESTVGLIPNLASYLIDAGGKRLRPMITLATSAAIGGTGRVPAQKLAAAVEFIHSATLLHDDVVDRSDLRRGKKAANLIWGNAASVLVGDFLFARSFNLMVEANDIEILDILARAASIIAEGEVLQLAAAGRADLSVDDYFRIIRAKTAALFAAAARVGAKQAGASPAETAAFAIYGEHLGLAFQLVDDVLDYGGLAATMGKSIGDDFREGKFTLPVLIARDKGTATEKAFWTRVMTGEQTPDDLDEALGILDRRDALRAALDVARLEATRAKSALSAVPPGYFVTQLSALADFCVDRAF